MFRVFVGSLRRLSARSEDATSTPRPRLLLIGSQPERCDAAVDGALTQQDARTPSAQAEQPGSRHTRPAHRALRPVPHRRQQPELGQGRRRCAPRSRQGRPGLPRRERAGFDARAGAGDGRPRVAVEPDAAQLPPLRRRRGRRERAGASRVIVLLIAAVHSDRPVARILDRVHHGRLYRRRVMGGPTTSNALSDFRRLHMSARAHRTTTHWRRSTATRRTSAWTRRWSTPSRRLRHRSARGRGSRAPRAARG